MIINCPNCTKIVAKGFEELEKLIIDFSFTTRCPHCKENIEIIVRTVKQVIFSSHEQIKIKKDPDKESIQILG
jgi:hypothetical protein